MLQCSSENAEKDPEEQKMFKTSKPVQNKMLGSGFCRNLTSGPWKSSVLEWSL
jgi:hypothetical protein